MPSLPPQVMSQTLVNPSSILYTVFFRQGMNPHPQSKNFNFKGNLNEAIQRAKIYCNQVGLRFVHCEPFLTDLDADERRRNGQQED